MAETEQAEQLLRSWVKLSGILKNNRISKGLAYNEAAVMLLVYHLYLEDGVVHIKCSPAKYISYVAGVRRNAARFGNEDFLTEASFEVDPGDIFFRISVVDEKGLHADTHAYFLDSLQ